MRGCAWLQPGLRWFQEPDVIFPDGNNHRLYRFGNNLLVIRLSRTVVRCLLSISEDRLVEIFKEYLRAVLFELGERSAGGHGMI